MKSKKFLTCMCGRKVLIDNLWEPCSGCKPSDTKKRKLDEPNEISNSSGEVSKLLICNDISHSKVILHRSGAWQQEYAGHVLCLDC